MCALRDDVIPKALRRCLVHTVSWRLRDLWPAYE